MIATVAPALADLLQTGKIRILDLIVLEREGPRGCRGRLLEFEAVASIADLRRVEGELGAMLSANDIHKSVLQAMAAAIVVDTFESLDLQWPTVSESLAKPTQRRVWTSRLKQTDTIHREDSRFDPKCLEV